MLNSRAARRLLALLAVAAAAVALTVAIANIGGGHPNSATPAVRMPQPAPVGDPHRPNIVFVLTDDLSTDLVQYMPNLQALERAGSTFTNYFVVDSLCCPSRSSIFTGEYPHNTKVFYNSGPAGGYDQFVREGDIKKTFAVSLLAAGYRTALMGKYLNRYPPKVVPSAGWSEWDVTGSEGYNEFNFHLNQNGRLHYYGHTPADYLTDVLGARAQSFIGTATATGRPFALEVATYAPHLPATPAPADAQSFPGLKAPRGPEWDRLPKNAPSWLARYPRLTASEVARLDEKFRLRVQAVQEVDRMIGRLRAELARRGVLNNTYFVFSSDNGFHLGQRRMLAGKQTAYDTDVRVPLIVTGPGVPAGRRVSTMTSSIDLAPTFEQIAEAHPKYSRDGVSLLGLWHGEPPPADWSNAVLIEHRSGTSPGDPDWQGSRSGMGPSYEALRTPTALYVEYANGDREYYDLRRDPDEMNNIVGQLWPGQVAALHRTLARMAQCRGADCGIRVQTG